MSTEIYESFAAKGTILDKKPTTTWMPRPKSAATIRTEKVDLAVNRRSNICPDCHMTRALTGNHDCD